MKINYIDIIEGEISTEPIKSDMRYSEDKGYLESTINLAQVQFMAKSIVRNQNYFFVVSLAIEGWLFPTSAFGCRK